MLRSFFIGLSTNKAFRAFSERSSIGRKVSRRFVAGMSIDEAIAATVQLNAEGIDVTLDSLGESVLDVAHAEASAAIYHQLLDAIESPQAPRQRQRQAHPGRHGHRRPHPKAPR